MTSRDPEAGVTLVEMLVALAIFALVGLASFALLDAVIRTRDRTEGRLEDVAALDRALILFGRDLGQSDPGSQALSGGELSFALVAAGGPEEMSYALGETGLERRAGEVAQRLAGGVVALDFRVLDRGGAWHEAWPPDAEGAEPPALVGVEMRLRLDGEEGATARRLVELPLGVPPEPSPLAFVPEEAG
jgi:general secretion pathway protein J